MKKTKFIYVLLLALAVGLFSYLCFKDIAIPYDDAYSAFMIKSSYEDIVRITAIDVHPPLYYWGLKAFSSIFGDSVFILRLFSMLGVFATMLLGCFPIRKLFGDKVAISFIILLLIFPVTQYLATDIRMYSWTMFFVLVCAVCAYKVYNESSILNWLLFFITSICAAYLHNYGLLSVLGIYLFLLFFLVYAKKKWYHLIICGLLFSAAYTPWLLQLVWQLNDVANDYWIKPLTLNDLFLHIYYFYSPKEVWRPFIDFTKVQMMIWLIVIMAIQLILTLRVIYAGVKEKDKVVSLMVISFLLFLFPVLAGAFISLTYVPILVTRYMTCSFGLFILSLSFVLAKVYEFPIYRKLSYIFIAMLLVTAGMRVYSGLRYYEETNILYEEVNRFVYSDGKKQKLVSSDFSFHVMPRLQLAMPDNGYYILKQGHYDNFRPFVFNEIDSISFGEFILVHQEATGICPIFRAYQRELLEHYIILDSLRIPEVYFYKLKLK